MSDVNHKQLDFMLDNFFECGKPMYVRGGIGIGKSTHIEEFAERKAGEKKLIYKKWNVLPRLGYDVKDEKGVVTHVTGKDDVIREPGKHFVFVDQRALMMDLGDFKLPKFDNNGGFEWCIPQVYQYLCNHEAHAILFLDEFNLAPPSIQGMFYSIINDREIGENRLGENVYVLAAGNNQKDRAAIYEMPMPLRNRFVNVNLEVPTGDDWAAWAVGAKKDGKEAKDAKDAPAKAEKSRVDMRVVSFLRFKPDLLYRPTDDPSQFAFATPRSWHALSIGIEKVTRMEDVRLVAEATVGEAVATEFIAYCKMANRLSLEDVLKNPKIVQQYVGEPAMMCSIAGGLIEKYRGDHKQLKGIAAVYGEMPDEFALWGFKMIKELAKGKFFNEIQNATDVKKFADRYGKYLLD